MSRICAALGADVHAWRTRPLTAEGFPYVFLDATYCHGRVGGGPQGKGGRVALLLACRGRSWCQVGAGVFSRWVISWAGRGAENR